MSKTVVAALAAALALGACAGRRGCCPPCPPTCAPEKPAPVVRREYLPPREESMICLREVAPRTRTAQVDDLRLCRDQEWVEGSTPVRCDVPVAETASTLAPVHEWTCAKTYDYARVVDTVPVPCNVCETKCVQVGEKSGLRCHVGAGCGRCGPFVSAGCERVRLPVCAAKRVKVGEAVKRVPTGSHLEQRFGPDVPARVHVGADRVTCITGWHSEPRVNGSACTPLLVDRGTKVRTVGTHAEPVVVTPGGFEGYEKKCLAPGRTVIVSDDPNVRGPGVVTSAEYAELVKSR